MRLRALALVALLFVAALAGYRYFVHRQSNVAGSSITVYYCKTDGTTLVPWNVSLGAPRDRKSVAFYAATQALAGPPSGTDAIRFPQGTIARAVDVSGSTATVDLGGNITSSGGGSFAEDGEFKALIWTMTALPGISSVQVTVDGGRVPTLPGGHLELDEPLTRQSW
jgi:N-acetylmuramoyl-L-alanine amidase